MRYFVLSLSCVIIALVVSSWQKNDDNEIQRPKIEENKLFLKVEFPAAFKERKYEVPCSIVNATKEMVALEKLGEYNFHLILRSSSGEQTGKVLQLADGVERDFVNLASGEELKGVIVVEMTSGNLILNELYSYSVSTGEVVQIQLIYVGENKYEKIISLSSAWVDVKIQ